MSTKSTSPEDVAPARPTRVLPDSDLFDTEQAAAYLNVKPSWVRQVLRYDDQIRPVKLGQKVRYEKRELDAYIANHRQVPVR
jgi:excisionase family DNA binding protein